MYVCLGFKKNYLPITDIWSNCCVTIPTSSKGSSKPSLKNLWKSKIYIANKNWKKKHKLIKNFTWSQQTQILVWILCRPESLLAYMFLINEVQLLWHKEQMRPSSAINLASNGSNWVQIATFVGIQL